LRIVFESKAITILESLKILCSYYVKHILTHECIFEALTSLVEIRPNIFFVCITRMEEQTYSVFVHAPAAFAGIIRIKNTADLKIVNDRIKAEIDTNVVSAIFERILAFQLLHPVIMASTR
jgi:hypothetical protein